MINSKLNKTIQVVFRIYDRKGNDGYSKSDLIDNSSNLGSRNLNLNNNSKHYSKEIILNLNISEIRLMGNLEGYNLAFDLQVDKNNLQKKNETPTPTPTPTPKAIEQKNSKKFIRKGTIRALTITQKYSNSSVVDNSQESFDYKDININIDKTFIPNVDKLCMIDCKNMSYVVNSKTTNIKDMRENIKLE